MWNDDSPNLSTPLRLHIGHHFFGSGNLGDDLMLAGFLDAVSKCERKLHLTSASAFDIVSQRRRFPKIKWLNYDSATREEAIRACDAWIGVGDTPFQIVVGPWFLDHLAAELEFCRKHNKPMYFVGIGVNEPAALDDSRARAVLEYAVHLWTRDERSAELISAAGTAERVTAGADLAHIYLSGRKQAAVEIGTIGYALNFEDPQQFDVHAFGKVSDQFCDRRARWLVQEDRPLGGSERLIYNALPETCRSRIVLCAPDYQNGTLEEMLATWGSPETLITSRYHAAVIGAWCGARVIAIERSDKIRGLAAQSGIVSVPDFRDPIAMPRAIERSQPVARARLFELARRAARSCDEMIEKIATPMPSSNLCQLARIEEKDSPRFCAFMAMVNAFASQFGLRTFTTWSKIWEYPWLWFAALGRIDWAGTQLMDLGSELSPMPWFLATLGAKVTLIEVDEQWIPLWQALRKRLGVNVSWHIVGSEQIPAASASVDVVSSLSVIEHQPNKRAAVDEVARVLKPGGVFAVSFDICEPDMGMTFPEWNGKALTLAEFEQTIWSHPAFGNLTRPSWNREDAEPFLAWHRTTAPHHNYVAGGAVLVKERAKG